MKVMVQNDRKSKIRIFGIIGYVLVSASANGFFVSVNGVSTPPPIVWILLGLAGSICLVLKNSLISNKKYSKIFTYGDLTMVLSHLAIMSFIPIYWGLGRAVVSLLFLGPYIFYFDNLRIKGVLDRS